jgi:hypothetical protein
MKTYNDSATKFILKLFSKQFGLHHTEKDLSNLWLTVGESWYSRLDFNNLSAEKMQQLAEEIMNSILKFTASTLYSRTKKNPS